jgi:hypothetical protein
VNQCTECTLARERAWHGMYLTACLGCRARGLARSQWAQQAVASRSAAELAEAVAAAMPSMPLAEAMAAVWDWWRMDHRAMETE